MFVQTRSVPDSGSRYLLQALEKVLTMATGSSTSDVEDILKNEFYFPSFRELGTDNDIDFRYWKEDCTGTYLGSSLHMVLSW